MNDCNHRCATIMHCETPDKCPVRLHSQEKHCWEVFFLHNNWEKVFDKCRNCKVFKLTANKVQEIG